MLNWLRKWRAVGFVLTLVYVIYNGIFSNNHVISKIFDFILYKMILNAYSSSSCKPTITSDRAFMEWKDNRYVCIMHSI